MPGLAVVTDFLRYCAHMEMASFNDVEARLSLPPGKPITMQWGPEEESRIWLLYYLSFGDIPADAFAIRCVHTPSVFDHECRPCGYEVIDPGCQLWCNVKINAPYVITIENLTDTTQTLVTRLWFLDISYNRIDDLNQAYRDFIRGKWEIK